MAAGSMPRMGAGGVGVAWVVGQERVRGVELRVG